MKELIWSLMEWLFSVTQSIGLPSYALAIVFLSVIIKILLHPVTKKQQVSMLQLKDLQPKMKAIEAKHKDNPEKKNEAIMKLYQTEKINPMASCLPMLIQLPILIILFNGLRTFVPVYPEFNTFFWITDLRGVDPTGLILPIAAGVTTFLQQYISIIDKNDKTQKTMLYVMPVVFGFMCRNFPAGLALYWVVFSIVSTVQMYVINKGIERKKAQDLIDNYNKAENENSSKKNKESAKK